MMEKIDSHKVFVEPFHVDFTGRIFMGVLGNHLLNAAGNHSSRRGWGIGALNETRHTWVLSRLSVEMTEMPRQNEHIEIRTWVESVMKLFTNRNFSIHRADGTPLGYARSVWAMIDMETRRPCDLLSLYDGDILNYVVSEEENVCPIEGHGRFRFREPELVRTLDVRYSDIDINRHVNSIKYMEHILDLFISSLAKSWSEACAASRLPTKQSRAWVTRFRSTCSEARAARPMWRCVGAVKTSCVRRV